MKKILVVTICVLGFYFFTCFQFGDEKICYGGTDVFGSNFVLRDSLVICKYGTPLSEVNKRAIYKKEYGGYKAICFINETEIKKFFSTETNIYSFDSERFLAFLTLNSECIYLYHEEPYLECHDVLYIWFFYKWVRVKNKLSLIS